MTTSSTIGASTVVRGSIRGDGDLEILGRVEGSVLVEGDLFIGESALIRSDVRAKAVTIRGAVAGDVRAEEVVRLETGARVVGDIVAPRIGIQTGALVRGNVSTSGEVKAVTSRAKTTTVASPQVRTQPTARTTAVVKPVAQAQQPASAHTVSRYQPPVRQMSSSNDSAGNAPPPPVVPALRKGARAALKKKGAR